MLHSTDLTKTRVSDVITEREALKASEDILDFYVSRYPEVFVVTCNKCKSKLALEYLDPNKPNLNHLNSRTVVELSDSFRSCRHRTDDVMGYECACGNDNRWAHVEWQVTGHGGANFPPHEVQAVKNHITSTNYVPAVKVKGNDMTIENKFTISRIK